MSTNYPKKCWYVAAKTDEVKNEPLSRNLLGTPVVLWRGVDGLVYAFENRCAHRGFPFTDSRIVDGHLVCNYHGCTYDTSGKCVYTPAQLQVPSGMSVCSFPVIEDGPFLWIWPGNPAAATQSPPTAPWAKKSHWTTFYDAWKVDANYMMLHEHYLDFSYAPVLHGNDLPPGLSSMGSFNDVEVTETTVSYTRVLPELPLADWQAEATGLDPSSSYKHVEGGTFVSPAIHSQYWKIENAAGNAFITTRSHCLTPESENSTHVFMQSSRNYASSDDAVTAGLRRFLDRVAQRDKSILEMTSRHSGYDGWRSGVEFQTDAAALRARRIVGVLLAKEAGRAEIRPGLAPNSRGEYALSPHLSASLGE